MLKHTTLAAAGAIALFGTIGQAATTNTVDATTGQVGTFFVPSVGLETTSPYYRGAGSDWGWTHGAIVGPFTTAELNVSAYDVDEAPCGFTPCEIDTIEAFDAATSTWILLGTLAGDNNAFSFTTFDLLSYSAGALMDDIAAGLQVGMDIDTGGGGWFVSLSKSVITTDGAGAGNPNPGEVPLPAAGWMMLAGLGAFGALRRRKRA